MIVRILYKVYIQKIQKVTFFLNFIKKVEKKIFIDVISNAISNLKMYLLWNIYVVVIGTNNKNYIRTSFNQLIELINHSTIYIYVILQSIDISMQFDSFVEWDV